MNLKCVETQKNQEKCNDVICVKMEMRYGCERNLVKLYSLGRHRSQRGLGEEPRKAVMCRETDRSGMAVRGRL